METSIPAHFSAVQRFNAVLLYDSLPTVDVLHGLIIAPTV